MITYSISKIAKLVRGEFLLKSSEGVSIKHLLLDSRQISFPPQSLFFAIKGQRHDGHQFIEEVYQKGGRNFILSSPVAPNDFPGANIILVKNTLRALQALVQHHRKQFSIPVIGITGSNGKTIVKEWLFQLLRADYHIVRSPRSYNSQVGVPLSVWQINEKHELGIFEAGISKMAEMQHLAPILQCDIGVFTNIGDAHNEGFSSQERKIKEKIKLFHGAKVIIFCKDNPIITNQIESLHKPVFSWSMQEKADLQVLQIQSNFGKKTTIIAEIKQEKYQITIPYTDRASIQNALHCWSVMTYLGVAQQDIAHRMSQLEPVAMRLELRAGIHGCTIINDSYNSDLNALKIALDFLVQQRQSAPSTLILSDILQSGKENENLYRQVAELVKEKQINHFIGIGSAVRSTGAHLTKEIKTTFYPDTNTFLGALDTKKFANQSILLKGARQFAFERIAERLAQKSHQTVLEVNLSALANNLQVYARQLKSNTKMCVMVKAAAYGSGSQEIARWLTFQKVDYLGVAYADEGVELRKAGIDLPIFVLNPEEAVFASLVDYRLEPEIYSLNQLKQFARFLNHPFPIHIKLDTGMHRLGFESEQIPGLITCLKQNPQLQVKSIFTHLAASDAAEHDSFTYNQIELYLQHYQSICQALGYRPFQHLLNSSGILRFPQYQMDMVRLGIGIYGIDPTNLVSDQLQTVLSLKASVSQLKYLEAGETVGYSRMGQVNQPSKVATISVGYADGLPRATGNGSWSVQIKGQLAPILGNVCMDMCMVDVSNVDEVEEGDEVIIFGIKPSVEQLAKVLNTIPYEVFTSVSPRVKRLYIQE